MFAFVYSLQNFISFEMSMDEETFDNLVDEVMEAEGGMDEEEGITDVICIYYRHLKKVPWYQYI